MTELIVAIERHLGRRVQSSDPSFYELLDVREDASLDEIKGALKNAAADYNKSDTKSDPESAQAVAKLLKSAQATLLDPEKRRAYDLAMQSVLAAQRAEVPVFPEADAMAAFDPKACYASVGAATIDSFGSVAERWQALQQQIPILLQEPAYTPAAAATEGFARRPESAESSRGNRESAAQRIEQLKRSRRIRQRMMLSGVVGVSVLFLAYAGYLFVTNRLQVQQQKIAAANADPLRDAIKQDSAAAAKPGELKNPRGRDQGAKPGPRQPSGLPTISRGETDDSKTGGTPSDATQSMAAPDAMVPAQPKPEEMKPAEAKPADEKPIDEKPMATTTEPAPSEPNPPTPASTEMKPEMNPEMKPEMAMPPASAKKEWVDAMKKGREAVEKADFETFQKQMDIALPLSLTADLTAKQARLDQMGQLYEIFIKAVKEAKAKLRGTEVITVGKNKVNIVELTEKELIVRIQGKNERYPWDRLPPGIAMALGDLTLDEKDPTDVAARAVYFSLSPSRNDLSAKKVKDWFEKSVGKGPIRIDLPQALTDTYE